MGGVTDQSQLVSCDPSPCLYPLMLLLPGLSITLFISGSEPRTGKEGQKLEQPQLWPKRK